MKNLLKMHAISKKFPGVQALSNVSIDVNAGEVHALVGENGAGKSTLMKILSGVYQAEVGDIIIKGKVVKIDNPKKAQQYGISMVFQEFNLCNELNIADNIFIGRHKHTYGIVDTKWVLRETQKIIDDMNLSLSPRQIVKQLSVAEKQLVEIAKAISLKADIIVFDEPTASLTETEVSRLFKIIEKLKNQGKGIVYISHRLNELDLIADRITILRDGEHIITANIKDISKDQIVKHMVGREIKNQYPTNTRKIGGMLFQAKKIIRKNQLNVENLYVRSGEIVGFAGLVGAGRTETARAIFGADPVDEMHLLMHGKQIEVKSPKSAVSHSIGYLTDDRKELGLALRMDVERNINMANYKAFKKNGFYRQKIAEQNATRYIDELSIRTPHMKQKVTFLSGGNQQKVVLAKWLCKGTDLLIFDEPTRGIDVGAKYEIYKLMNELSAKGFGMILISSDLPEILGMSDRIYVFCNGSVQGVLESEKATQELILSYAAGLKSDTKQGRI